MNELNTKAMFKFLFGRNEKKSKHNQDEYTPEMKDQKPLHDKSEGGEFLDDVVEFEEPTSSAGEENIRG